MPVRVATLTASQVEKIAKSKRPGRYAVGGRNGTGLYLRVEGNSVAWVLRTKIGRDGRRVETGLGRYIEGRDTEEQSPVWALLHGKPEPTEKTLGEALKWADEKRKAIRSGDDPIAAKREAAAERRAVATASKIEAITFKECAEAYLEEHQKEWKNPKHVAQWGSTLDAYAYPIIGSLPVSSIETEHVLDVLKQPKETRDKRHIPLWEANTETASRLRGRIEKILGWATFRKWRVGLNPARWRDHLDHELAARNRIQKPGHHAALPYAELGAFMVELRKREGISARALEFAILCASRSGEIRLAKREEFDLEGALWTIPSERMKAGKEHRVPLSEAAVAILRGLPTIGGSDFMFPAARGKPLSDMSMPSVLKRMGRASLTQHGFRSTFRDWAGETTAYPREVIEHALAHQLKDKAEAAYQRGDLLAKRSRLMSDWAAFCSAPADRRDNVIAIKSAS